MENSPKSLSFLCLLVTSACLGMGYAGFSLGIAAILAPLIFGLAAYRWPSNWTITSAFLVSTVTSSIGLLIGGSSLWLMVAFLLALAGWDLVLFGNALSGSSWFANTASLLMKHYLSLGMVIGLGILIIVASSFLAIQIPFVVMILLVALAFFTLERLWRSLSS